MVQYQHNNNALVFRSNATTALTIDSSQKATFAGEVDISSGGASRCNMRHSSGGDFVIKNPTAASLGFGVNNADNSLVITNSGNVVSTGTVSDSIGNLRSIVYTSKTSAHTLVASDAGKLVYISTGGVTLPNNVMSGGDAITIINNSGSDQTITQASGLTLYNTADAATGNRTLAGRGMATVWYHGGSTAYISGAGLS